MNNLGEDTRWREVANDGETRRPNEESEARASIAALQTCTLIDNNRQTTFRIAAGRRQHSRHRDAINMSPMSIILFLTDDCQTQGLHVHECLRCSRAVAVT